MSRESLAWQVYRERALCPTWLVTVGRSPWAGLGQGCQEKGVQRRQVGMAALALVCLVPVCLEMLVYHHSRFFLKGECLFTRG